MSRPAIAIRPAHAGDTEQIVLMSREFEEQLAAIPVDPRVPGIPEPDDITLTEDLGSIIQ